MPFASANFDDNSLPSVVAPAAGTLISKSKDDVSSAAEATLPAGRLPAWEIGTLEDAPRHSWRDWSTLIGPGILLAGSSVGAGEWLFGPAVTAQFGGTFLWLATISIITQAFYNLEVMRYTLYCGEPVFVGFFRLAPGPKFWTAVYLILCVAHIWPFMASNAAVPVAAAILGHLPEKDHAVHFAGWLMSDSALVKLLGYVIFMLAFLPLIFGGKIYNVLERMMAVKLVIVLGFLVGVGVFLISPRNAWEVVTGFFRFGQVSLQAETILAGPYFDLRQRDGSSTYVVKGTVERGQPMVASFGVVRGRKVVPIETENASPEQIEARDHLMERIRQLVKPHQFFVETARHGTTYQVAGEIKSDGAWSADRVTLTDPEGKSRDVRADQLQGADAALVNDLVNNQGFERASLVGHWNDPSLDWPLLAGFAAIAGAGMLSNALFSNYARDKGWGMGAQTGAIPSAVGGHRISLSHVGKVFIPNEKSLLQWRGWFRHILRDQVIWIVCSVVGMALPCMMTLEFVRNAPVSENRAAALPAEGLSLRFPAYAGFWWGITLFVGFMVLAPNAVFAGDLIARLWTDLIWIGSAKVKDRPGNSVMRVYYGILIIYCVWGIVILAFLKPMQVAKVGTILGNVALGFSAFHTLAVNRRLLPEPLRPNLFMQLGLFACGVFFLGITAVVALNLLS